MKPGGSLEEVLGGLQRLVAALAAGNHGELEVITESLAPSLAALESALERARAGRASAGVAGQCEQLRRMAADIQRMIAHAEQVRRGLAGILLLRYDGGRGALYSPDGEPCLDAPVRLCVEA